MSMAKSKAKTKARARARRDCFLADLGQGTIQDELGERGMCPVNMFVHFEEF